MSGSGGSFFVGNLLVGRYLNGSGSAVHVERVLVVGAGVAFVAMVAFYVSSALPVALVCTAALGLSHATVAACVVTLLVRRCDSSRGSALSLNAAGMSFGVLIGAGLGGIGLGVAGYPGTAAVLGGPTLLALLAGSSVRRVAT